LILVREWRAPSLGLLKTIRTARTKSVEEENDGKSLATVIIEWDEKGVLVLLARRIAERSELKSMFPHRRELRGQRSQDEKPKQAPAHCGQQAMIASQLDLAQRLLGLCTQSQNEHNYPNRFDEDEEDGRFHPNKLAQKIS
jgi:hypothetical protein